MSPLSQLSLVSPTAWHRYPQGNTSTYMQGPSICFGVRPWDGTSAQRDVQGRGSFCFLSL